MYLKKIIFIFLTVILSGCHQKKSFNIINKNIQDNNYKIAYLKISGIECDFCAKEIINLLLKISNIKEAEFDNKNYINKDYYKQKIKILYSSDKKNIHDLIKEIIEKEGFNLEEILYL